MAPDKLLFSKIPLGRTYLDILRNNGIETLTEEFKVDSEITIELNTWYIYDTQSTNHGDAEKEIVIVYKDKRVWLRIGFDIDPVQFDCDLFIGYLDWRDQCTYRLLQEPVLTPKVAKALHKLFLRINKLNFNSLLEMTDPSKYFRR